MTKDEALIYLYSSGMSDEQVQTVVSAIEQAPKSEWQKDHEILKAYSDGAREALEDIRAEVNKLKRFELRGKITPLVNADRVLGIIDKHISGKE